jgi:aryl-alcohol dehydrogenase-like predicted oxidoreductase
MRVNDLGQSGVAVSAIGLGGWELRGGDESAGDPSVAQLRALFDAALEEGVDWIDTAEGYAEGRNETAIGRSLDTRVVQLVSKVAPDASGFRPDQVHAACRASLGRLRRDHLDVYLMHYPDKDNGVPLLETWGAMAELVHQGLARAIGLSNYKIEQIESAHAERQVNVIQQGLSLIDYLDERATIARCGELGIGALVYEPMAGGVLTGAVGPGTDFEAIWEEGVTEWPFFTRLLAPGKMERSMAVLDGVRSVAKRLDTSPGQVAIAWVLAQSGVSAAIAGSSNPIHVRENARAASLELSEEFLGELDELIPLGPTWQDPDRSES